MDAGDNSRKSPIEIDETKCIGCASCSRLEGPDAIVLDGVARIVDPDKITRPAKLAKECPVKAIKDLTAAPPVKKEPRKALLARILGT